MNVKPWQGHLQASSPFAGQTIVAKIIALIEQRSALITRRLLAPDNETEDEDIAEF